VQIEQAYRELIKRYHPDRGGDGERAAEINRAYRELRALPLDQLHVAPMAVSPRPMRPRMRGGRIVVAMLAMAGISLAAASTSVKRSGWPGSFPVLSSDYSPANVAGPGLVAPFTDFDEPIVASVIVRSVDAAFRLHEGEDPDALINYSRTCQSRFRQAPSLTWFDSCAAYDEAVVLLEARDPIVDSGPFNAAAVTAREMGEGRLLSDDPMAVDSRLHEIRSQVQMSLLPRLADPVPATDRN
jgi:hypothetical protein